MRPAAKEQGGRRADGRKRCKGGPRVQDLHGFRVHWTGRLPTGFRHALEKLSERGFADRSCLVVYLHEEESEDAVLADLEKRGISLPCVVAGSANELYDVWVSRLDDLWSDEDAPGEFSPNWLSRYCAVGVCRAEYAEPDMSSLDLVPIPLKEVTLEAAVNWVLWASSVFRELFVDWMKDTPERLCADIGPFIQHPFPSPKSPRLVCMLKSEVSEAQLRREAAKLFERGPCPRRRPPAMKDGFFGPYHRQAAKTIRSFLKSV
jgi:hypothetical protein